MTAKISPHGFHILPPDKDRPNLQSFIRDDMFVDPQPPKPAPPPPLHCFADLPVQPQDWLWPGRIPCGDITLLCGDEGRGKSLVTLDVAARVSAGLPWPHGGPSAPPADVLILSAEDSLGRTVRARLVAAGADLQRVHYLAAAHWSNDPHLFEGSPSISVHSSFGVIPTSMHDSLGSDVRHLKAALEALPDCRLVVIDPFPAYLDRSDLYVDEPEQIRTYLSPLTALADRFNVAVIAVIHRDQLQRPQNGRKRHALRTLAGMSRVAYLIDRSPDDRRAHVMLPLKNNLGDAATGASFTVVEAPGGAAIVQWSSEPLILQGDDLDVPRSDAERPRRLPEIQRAIAWLLGVLSGGPIPSHDLITRAEAAGFNHCCLKRARARLGVRATNSGAIGGQWMCSLPPSETQNPQEDHFNTVLPSTLSTPSLFPDVSPTIPNATATSRANS